MKKKIPIGTQSFRKLRDGNYYTVDKSLLIQEFLERGNDVTLITRPRRFGKTLNMSMLAEFFDITKDSKDIFEGLDIMNTEYANEMNQWPVIFISFIDCKGKYELSIKSIFQSIRKEYARYKHIFDKDEYDEDILSQVRENYVALCARENPDEIVESIRTLCEFLFVVYKKKPMIFLDEYDTPFVEAHVNQYYDKIHDVLAGIMRTTLKSNDYYQYAMITGIQRVAKENIFSDLNNLKVFTVLDEQYSQYFGFNSCETKIMLEAYDLELNNDVKQMYDGYQYGGQEIYNPWSIINYVDTRKLLPYWVNSSSNTMIKRAIKKVESTFIKEYDTLIQTGSVTTSIDTGTSFYEKPDRASLWGMFVNAGYITIVETVDLRNHQYKLRIPNIELMDEFIDLTAFRLNVDVQQLLDLYSGILNNDKNKFLNAYQNIQLVNPSYNDLISENSYHMFLLGICLFIQNDYEILSNRESGKGRSDLTLKAKRSGIPSYVIELTHLCAQGEYANSETYEKNPEILKTLAIEAIEQIKVKKYDVILTGDIVHIGLAHHGKNVEMMWAEMQ